VLPTYKSTIPDILSGAETSILAPVPLVEANLENILLGCDNPVGGIKRLLINSSENVTSITASASTWTINAIGVTSSQFTQVEFRKNLGTYTEPYTMEPDGAIIYLPEIVIPIHGRDAAKSRKISILAEGQRYLDIIAEDNKGQDIYFEEMQLSAVADGSGAAKTEASKYTITFTGESENLSYYVDPSIIAGLL
jgi:hypothetical protein